jgi:hypothetical protein
MDSVNNRSLFRRKSQAARDKVRQMGMVQEPQGILASFQELMEVAGRNRTQNLMPQMMQQAQPVRFQQGGDIAMEALRQGAPEPTLGEQIAANPAFAGVIPPQVDIAATPTPRPRVEVPDIASMVRQNLGDNEEAQAKFSNVVDTLSDPEAGEERVQEVLTENFGAPNTDEGMRRVVSQITGRELPESATVDELNRAMTGVALGGAIGGPRSVAERISQALLTGLEAQRETAAGREAFEQQITLAGVRSGGGGEDLASWLESPQGKRAADLFEDYTAQRNLTPEAAIELMNSFAPGLGNRYAQAMAEGLVPTAPGETATTPATPAAPVPALTAPTSPEETARLLEEAREAVKPESEGGLGRDRGVVEQMLRDAGIDPAGL